MSSLFHEVIYTLIFYVPYFLSRSIFFKGICLSSLVGMKALHSQNQRKVISAVLIYESGHYREE